MVNTHARVSTAFVAGNRHSKSPLVFICFKMRLIIQTGLSTQRTSSNAKHRFLINRIVFSHENNDENSTSETLRLTFCGFVDKGSLRLTFKELVQPYPVCLLMNELKRSKSFRRYLLRTILLNFGLDIQPNVRNVCLHFHLSTTQQYLLLKYW